MKSILSLDETPSALERSFKVATKFMHELPMNIEMESIPLEGLLSLVEDIHVKTQEASQNTDLDMREFLGIDKVLQGIFELLNNALKWTKINERINKERKKLKEVENDPTFSEDRLYDLNIEKQARLEILSQNQKDLQTEAARIKQNLEKVFDKNASLAERIRALFFWTGYYHNLSTYCPFDDNSMTLSNSTIVLAITDVFEGGAGSPSKKWRGFE